MSATTAIPPLLPSAPLLDSPLFERHTLLEFVELGVIFPTGLSCDEL